MPESVILEVGGDFGPLERGASTAWQRMQSSFSQRPMQVRIDDQASLPLGRITGNARDLDRALTAATQRVVAFGAAMSIINVFRNALNELVKSAIDVEYSMSRINIGLNTTKEGLKDFGSKLFDIARNTGSSFNEVAKAAEQLSRQGLSTQETLKRINDVMILTRTTGVSTTEAIAGLTATINSFSREAITSSDIINKMAAVSASFAVSTKDLDEAISRVGFTASEAGVSFNQLAALVTSAQQITQRGGNVIGNALNTIFTNVREPKVLKDLQGLGVAVKDASGNVLSGTTILQNLASQYDKLSEPLQSVISQEVAGKRQSDVFLAVLRDLGKETGTYSNALNTLGHASNQAYMQNEELNKSLKSMLNSSSALSGQFFSKISDAGVNPAMKAFVGTFNSALKAITSSDNTGIGKSIGDGIIQGISNVLTGPALVGILKFASQVIVTFGTQAVSMLKNFSQINNEAKDRAAVQGRINELLAIATAEERNEILNATSLAEKKRLILSLDEQITAQMRMQQLESSALQTSLLGKLGGIKVHNFATGYTPIEKEQNSISQGVGGAMATAKPIVIPNFAFGGGKFGPVVANTDEYLVENYAEGGSAIFTRDMVNRLGLPPNAKHLANGYTPNVTTNTAENILGATQQSPLFIPTQWHIKQQQDELKHLIGDGLDLSKVDLTQPKDKLKTQIKSVITESLNLSPEALKQKNVIGSIGALTNEAISIRGGDIQSAMAQKAQDLKDLVYQTNITSDQIRNGRQLTDDDIRRRTVSEGISKISDRSLKDLLGDSGNTDSGTRIAQRLLAERSGIDVVSGGGPTKSLIDIESERRLAAMQNMSAVREEFSERNTLRSLFSRRRGDEDFARDLGVNIESDEGKQLLSLAASKRAQAWQHTSMTAAFVAPFAAGFIPEGQGGTFAGGALGGVKGAAEGAGIGGIFGPAGLAIGAGIGALVGIFSKLSKSTEELANEMKTASVHEQTQLSNADKLASEFDNLQLAIKSGASKDVIAKMTNNVNTLKAGISDTNLLEAFQSGNIDKFRQTNQNFREGFEKNQISRSMVLMANSGNIDQQSFSEGLQSIVGAGRPETKSQASQLFGLGRFSYTGDMDEGIGRVMDTQKKLADLRKILESWNPEFKNIKLNADNAAEIAMKAAYAMKKLVESSTEIPKAISVETPGEGNPFGFRGFGKGNDKLFKSTREAYGINGNQSLQDEAFLDFMEKINATGSLDKITQEKLEKKEKVIGYRQSLQAIPEFGEEFLNSMPGHENDNLRYDNGELRTNYIKQQIDRIASGLAGIGGGRMEEAEMLSSAWKNQQQGLTNLNNEGVVVPRSYPFGSPLGAGIPTETYAGRKLNGVNTMGYQDTTNPKFQSPVSDYNKMVSFTANVKIDAPDKFDSSPILSIINKRIDDMKTDLKDYVDRKTGKVPSPPTGPIRPADWPQLIPVMINGSYDQSNRGNLLDEK